MEGLRFLKKKTVGENWKSFKSMQCESHPCTFLLHNGEEVSTSEKKSNHRLVAQFM